MTKYTDNLDRGATPQTQRAHPDQVINNAGGYTFALDNMKRLERFLILGSDGNTFYQTAKALTRENAKVVEECWRDNPALTAGTIMDISDAGRAPKNDPAIFALALGVVSPNDEARKYAYAAVPRVCRTGTHIMQFVATALAFGKKGSRGMKRAVGDWYQDKALDDLAYQVVKYRQREGMTHQMILSMFRPKPATYGRGALYRWLVGKDVDVAALPGIVGAHLAAMKTETAKELIPIIADFPSLPWEAMPTWAKGNAEVQRAVVHNMPMTALIRNLGNLTRMDVIKPLSDDEATVVARLGDENQIRKARVHPLAVLTASTVYGSGRGLKGGGSWSPNQSVMSALEKAFYMAFQNVVPSGKRTLLALDVSGSMGGGSVGGSPLTPRAASAAMALVTMRTEPSTHVIGFTGGTKPLNIHPGMSLSNVVGVMSHLPFDTTDCAQPMLYAMSRNLMVDTFVIYTDSETYHGAIHPYEALRRYRKQTGIPAKLIVVGMTSTGFTIANPSDAGMLDVVGFDASAPAVMADFARD